MIVSPFSSPRKLALLAVIILLTIVLHSRHHRQITKDQLTQSPSFEPSHGASKITKVKHLPHQVLQKKIKQLINWKTLNTDYHWPSWEAYRDKDYDPNRWEGFEWETGVFTNNGIKRLQEQTDLQPQFYLPYPDYNSEPWRRQWKGEYVACQGPRGKNLTESVEDMVMAYRGIPEDFPKATIGTANVVGLDTDVCFDRYHRYGPYGFDQDSNTPREGWDRPSVNPDWSSIWWGQLQNACLERNKGRFAPEQRAPMNLVPQKELPLDHDLIPTIPDNDDQTSRGWFGTKSLTSKHHSRTALLIRTWEGYTYTENDIQAIRAMVTELALLTGGEYQVYLFVNVKQADANIYTDPHVYQTVLRKVVPRELRDISLLWTEKVCESWYPEVKNWQVYWQQFMPLQWFSKTHPEFDYVWNWETDARYTGNHFHFLEKVVEFARAMPRKNMWERNARFYFESAHGNYASFLADTDESINKAYAQGTTTPVWGALPYNESQQTTGPSPPRTYDQDNFEWGAGEEADLITLQPIWDPSQTKWSYRDKIWNYVKGVRPKFTQQDPGDDDFTHPDFAKIPRRVFINTVARFSKKMLHAMHVENLAGRSMQAEMWPATVALQHGLKAVYAPHPIWTDRKWPAWYLDATFNADSGETAAWGQRADSPYNKDREAAFRGWSWYFSAGFPRVIYRRFLGWEAMDILGEVGGESLEEQVRLVGGVGQVGGQGRMCLPGMLLHPVKKVREDNRNWFALGYTDLEDLENEKRITKEVEELLDQSDRTDKPTSEESPSVEKKAIQVR